MSVIFGAILAGGASSRMGSNKALVEVAGRPMSAWVSEALGTVVLDASHKVSLGNTEVAGVARQDDWPGTGPLSGLAAMTDVADQLGVALEAVIVVAVDHPWLRSETLRGLVDRFDTRAVVPTHNGVRQVTCAVYPLSFVVSAAAGAVAAKGFQALLDGIDVDEVPPDTWKAWGEDGRSWFSVDTPDDIERGLKRFGPPG